MLIPRPAAGRRGAPPGAGDRPARPGLPRAARRCPWATLPTAKAGLTGGVSFSLPPVRDDALPAFLLGDVQHGPAVEVERHVADPGVRLSRLAVDDEELPVPLRGFEGDVLPVRGQVRGPKEEVDVGADG